MKTLEIYRLCRKISQVSLQRDLHTGFILSARQKKKVVQYTKREPGIQNRKELFADTELPEKECEEDDDYIHEEAVNIENIDRAYDEDNREKKQYKEMADRSMTYNKYFAPSCQPPLLTSNEIECIKYLNQTEPLNWDVQALSESFPATPEIIRKILKAKYKLSPERAKQKDEAVYKNWELLAEGKLEADPKLIEHCKKFIDRREVLLEQIKNSKFYLPVIQQEPTYNNGEMSKILIHYEKRLEELKNKRESKMLKERSKPEEERKKYLDLLHEEVEKVISKRYTKKESSTLSHIVKKYSKEVTFEVLENESIQRAEKNKKIGLTEKAILESKFGTPQRYTKDTESTQQVDEVKSKRIPQKLLKKETSVTIKAEAEKNKSYKLDTFDDDLPDLPSPDERTCFTKELGVGQLLHKIRNPEELETEEFSKIKSPYIPPDAETMANEKEHLDKQVEDIKNTPFWNNKLGSKDKAELERKKGPLQAPGECKRITKADIQVPDEYPLKIFIPKSKRGSGLTFRVNDCFYDDDGEFLYRVPGLVLEKTN